MAKNKNTPSPETISDAESIAKATQRPGQTKEQTKLIAKGIEKGIAEYKKRQKSKARELDKKLRKVTSVISDANTTDETPATQTIKRESTKLPWLLLILSWLGFATYLLINNIDAL